MQRLYNSGGCKLIFECVYVSAECVIDRLKEFIDLNRLLCLLQLCAVLCIYVGDKDFKKLLEDLIVTKATQQQSQHCDGTGNAV